MEENSAATIASLPGKQNSKKRLFDGCCPGAIGAVLTFYRPMLPATFTVATLRGFAADFFWHQSHTVAREKIERAMYPWFSATGRVIEELLDPVPLPQGADPKFPHYRLKPGAWAWWWCVLLCPLFLPTADGWKC